MMIEVIHVLEELQASYLSVDEVRAVVFEDFDHFHLA